MRAKPVDFPPPKSVLNPKHTTTSAVVLYILASISRSSDLGTEARLGCNTSTIWRGWERWRGEGKEGRRDGGGGREGEGEGGRERGEEGGRGREGEGEGGREREEGRERGREGEGSRLRSKQCEITETGRKKLLYRGFILFFFGGGGPGRRW